MINDKLKQVADLMQECVKAGKMEWKNDHGDWYEWRGDDLPNIAMFENGTIRPHDPLREFKEAFARGETVEFYSEYSKEWMKIDNHHGWSRSPKNYRIAPKCWYRVALTRDGDTLVVSDKRREGVEQDVESNDYFVRWLTPERVYY